jgi:hypothetical protein
MRKRIALFVSFAVLSLSLYATPAPRNRDRGDRDDPVLVRVVKRIVQIVRIFDEPTVPKP